MKNHGFMQPKWTKVYRSEYAKLTDQQLEDFEKEVQALIPHNRAIHIDLAGRFQAAKKEFISIFGEDTKICKYIEKKASFEFPLPHWATDMQYHFDNFKRGVLEERGKLAWEKQRQLRQRQVDEAEKKAIRQITRLALKYGLPVDADAFDVLDYIRAQDRYLDLAYAMLDTRNDWSEGFDRVSYALERFKKQSDNSEQDLAIIEDIADCLSSDESDGRIFRDTKWNYDVLFNLANSQLVEDADLIREMENN